MLGFNIPDEDLGAITYSRKRLAVEVESFRNPSQLSVDIVKRFLLTKYSHWRYENEVRCFVTLEDRDLEKNLYFADFSERLRLAMVIVGAESNVTREVLRSALGELALNVEIFKARLAFGSFKVVRQRNRKLWI